MPDTWSFILLIIGATQLLALSPARNANSTICKPWNCINGKIVLNAQENDLFNKNKWESYLTALLPDTKWREAVNSSLDSCLAEKKPRPYSTTCPGQETWHCIVDQLIQNCPDGNLKKENSCTALSSLVGANYLFYQNTYVNIDSEVHNDRRNEVFLRNVFKSKCCVLPSLLTSSVVEGCGVSTFLHVQSQQTHALRRPSNPSPTPFTSDAYCTQNTIDNINPLECCDTRDLVASQVFETCNVGLEWKRDKRFVLIDKEIQPGTEGITSEGPPTKQHRNTDVKVIPESCSGVTCVFKKLNIMSTSGSIDKDAFSSLLANMTHQHPEWAPARARVLTRCLKRDLRMEYEGCEVTKLVACTLDVLAENCPHTKKGFSDPCRHPSKAHNTTSVCQVSTSKYRRVRHRYCDVPPLAPPTTLHECGLISLSRMVTVTDTPVDSKKHSFSRKPACITTSNTTNCVLSKMGVLNKYKFMDSLKMKELVGSVMSKNQHWSVHRIAIEDALNKMPHYKDYCVSTRKLLNVLDAAITNCPFSKRTYTSKCMSFYGYINRCTNKTVIPSPTPFTNRMTSLISPPLNVRFLNSNTTVAVSRIYAPVAHTVSRYPKYATSYPQYIHSRYLPVRTPFANSKFPPTTANSNLGVFLPQSRPNLGQPFPGVYSPIYSHGYVPYASLKPSTHSNTPLLVKDNYRSDNPFFIHNKIAAAHKDEKLKENVSEQTVLETQKSLEMEKPAAVYE